MGTKTLHVEANVDGVLFMIDEKEFYSLKGDVEIVKKTVERIDKKLFGNGDPGIYETTIRQDEELKDLRETSTQFALSMTEFRKSLEACSKRITEAEPKIWIIRHWKSILFSLAIMFIIFHAVLPADLTIWEVINSIP